MITAPPVDYNTLPVELFSVTDLTDALSVEVSAKLLKTSRRVIYTVRSTNALGHERVLTLIDAILKDEANCRRRLVILRNMKRVRDARKNLTEGAKSDET